MTETHDTVAIRRALISVSDKAGILEFARSLREQGVELISTGGTARRLNDAGIDAVEVSNYTGFPEILGGRVKSLHPRIHAGLLSRREVDDETLQAHAIPIIDLAVVNLYPFEQTIADPACDLSTAIENIDIGGPTLLRAAAKNYDRVTVVVDPRDYHRILAANGSAPSGGVPRSLRFELAAKAFAHVTAYDCAIANYLGGLEQEGQRRQFPSTLSLQFELAQAMRYGENPHQHAAFYRDSSTAQPGIGGARQIQGKPLSFNNVADADAALECVKQFDEPACVIVKHANPCGVAVASDLLQAYERAFRTDPTSAFGGIIACNRPLDGRTVSAILERQFVEVIIAPKLRPDALPVLAKKQNVRALNTGMWGNEPLATLDYKRVTGGLLVQDRDIGAVASSEPKVVTTTAPSPAQLRDLLFAWKVAKFVKSNAIVYARDQGTVGVGAGQMSRVYSARIAALKAADEGIEVAGSVMASDAFLPFRDAIDMAAQAGIAAVIQPGGSIRDNEVIDAANEHGIAMVFTGMRHFRH